MPATHNKPQTRKPEILITGAAGALTQQVITRLRQHYRIVAVDFREQVYLGDDIPSYRVDFTKRILEDIFLEHNFSAVIHLGRIMSSEGDRMSRYNANVIGTQRLFDLCHKYGVKKVIVLSTFHVYGANAYNPALIDESAPLKAAELTMDLVDSVELENLAAIYLWKHPDLNMTILRPCNIVGPGVRNSISMLLSRRRSPVLVGFSPIMQFIHIDDMADAIVLAFDHTHSGIYNVAPDDWVSYQDALHACGCATLPLPSIPPLAPRVMAGVLNMRAFPPYLINYFKYPVVIDNRLFKDTFGFKPRRNLREIFRYYQERK